MERYKNINSDIISLNNKENLYKYNRKYSYKQQLNESTTNPISLMMPKKQSIITDITNKLSVNKFNRSFNSFNMFSSNDELDNKRQPSFQGPLKINKYKSITDSSNDFKSFKNEKTLYMDRWNKSVVDSVDFLKNMRDIDEKETNDALNAAIYAEDIHLHCLNTEMK